MALEFELLKQVQSLEKWRIFLADKFNESTDKSSYAKTIFREKEKSYNNFYYWSLSKKFPFKCISLVAH